MLTAFLDIKADIKRSWKFGNLRGQVRAGAIATVLVGLTVLPGGEIAKTLVTPQPELDAKPVKATVTKDAVVATTHAASVEAKKPSMSRWVGNAFKNVVVAQAALPFAPVTPLKAGEVADTPNKWEALIQGTHAVVGDEKTMAAWEKATCGTLIKTETTKPQIMEYCHELLGIEYKAPAVIAEFNTQAPEQTKPLDLGLPPVQFPKVQLRLGYNLPLDGPTN